MRGYFMAIYPLTPAIYPKALKSRREERGEGAWIMRTIPWPD